MVFAILIGFQYSHERFLPGIVVDLYQVYHYLRCVCPYIDIAIITDIKKDSRAAPLMNALVEGIIDSEALSFIEDTRQRGHLHQVDESNAKSVLMEVFQRMSQRDDPGFIYYTGHGIASNPNGAIFRGNWLLPNWEKLSVSKILDELLRDRRSQSGVDLVIIMDCCGLGEIPLPYRLRLDPDHPQQGRFHLNVSVPDEDLLHHPNDVLVLTSTRHNEQSATTKSGSIFTRTLFRLLNQCYQEQRPFPLLPALVQQVDVEITKLQTGYPQSVTVYSALPMIYRFPTWFYGFDLTIDRDPTHDFLKIRPRCGGETGIA